MKLFESLAKSPWDIKAFFFLGLFQFAAFIYYFPQAIILIPYGDALDWISSFYASKEEGFFRHLFTPHNKHIIVIPRLLLAADAQFFNGLSYPVALVCLTFLLVASAIIIYQVSNHFAQANVRLFVISVTLILLFPTFRYTNYTSLPNCNIPPVGFFSFLSLVFIMMSFRGVGKKASIQIIYYSLSIITAFCASWGSLNGYLVWPIMIFIVLRLKGGALYALPLLFFSLLSLIPFAQNIESPVDSPENSLAPFTFAWLLNAGRYLIELYGMPWSYVNALYWPAVFIGLALFSTCLFSLVYFAFGKRDNSSISLMALSMLVFSTLTILLIVIGRAHAIPQPAHRYGFYVTVSLVSVLLLWAPYLERHWTYLRSKSLLRYGALLLGALLVAQQVPIGRFASARAAHFHELDQIIIANDPHPEDVKLIYPRNEHRNTHYKMLERHAIYSFRK